MMAMYIHNADELREIVDSYFKHPSPVDAHKAEVMFQAFKARLILELRVSGGSRDNVVYGKLEPYTD
jgi:hypothetical protein